MTSPLPAHLHRITCAIAVVMWLAYGSSTIKFFLVGDKIVGTTISPVWFIPFGVFGVAMLAAMALHLRPLAYWGLLVVQLAAVMAMALILPWAGMSMFLIIIAWQAAMATSSPRAVAWTIFQTLAVVGSLAQALNPDLCWVIAKSVALQLLLVFTARALRRESETARALAQSNRELRAAQAIIANNARDAERTRISRELHDAWGHELTALGLQLEIASHVDDPAKVGDHVSNAKRLSSALLSKVRDVVATLREAERSDLKVALDSLARSIPTPAVHVAVAKGVAVDGEQAHALIRCAQEAVTNAVKHSSATNLWLEVMSDRDGIRLVARNDGTARPPAQAPGTGLIGMRERIESLGGRLALGGGGDAGFTIDAWLPRAAPQPA